MTSYLDSLGEFHEDKKKEVAPRVPEVANLLKTMGKWVDAWPDQETHVNNLRASQMHEVCPREFVLHYWQPKPNKYFGWKSQFMMGIGSHLHEYIQNAILGPMGILWGNWERKAHDVVVTTSDSFHPDPERAIWEITNQKPLSYSYVEPKIWNNTYRISGHIDGIISLEKVQWLFDNTALVKRNLKDAYKALMSVKDDPEDRVLFEFKTTGSFVFKKIVGPESIAPYYKTQNVIYQANKGVFRTLFWYMNRDDMRSKAMIYNYEKPLWTEAKRKARIIWKSIRDEVLPDDMKACRLPTDARAKKCAYKEECFGSRFNFTKYVEEGKKLAKEKGRKLLDLSAVIFEGE